MKFKVLKNVWLGKDNKTGRVRSCSKGEVLDFGPEDMEVISELVRNFFIAPFDSALVPDTGRYKVLYQFQQEVDGQTVKGTSGAELKLERDIAVNLMARGYVVPVDPDAWYPGKPSFMPNQPPKKMYDEG
jgi:hypothetical protein